MWLPSHHYLIDRSIEISGKDNAMESSSGKPKLSKLSAARVQRAVDKRHFNLASQQRRLRHLGCVSCRNVKLPIRNDVKGINNVALYFTIHSNSNDDKDVLYRSESINSTINPNWREFDSTMLSSDHDNTSTSLCGVLQKTTSNTSFYCKSTLQIPESAGDSSINTWNYFVPISYTMPSKNLVDKTCTICVWYLFRGKPNLLIKLSIEFASLHFIALQLKSDDARFPPNTVLLKLQGGYYATAPQVIKTAENESDDAFIKALMKVDQETVKWTYSKSSVMRIHCMLKAVAQTKVNVACVKSKIQQRIKSSENILSKRAKRDLLSSNVAVLREEQGLQDKSSTTELSQCEYKQNQMKQREQNILVKQDDVSQKLMELKLLRSLHVQKRENLLKLNALLSFRRKQQISELSFIYPVIELPVEDSDGHYAICNVRLPHSENFGGQDDEMLAVALGYTSHFVHMLAKILLLPLRYPLKPMGSRSTVLDYITDRLTDKEREFPLYTKGKEKFQFHYGVFLLNKDIAQIRYQCGLGTADLRNTLSNVKQLLEMRFGIKSLIETPEALTKASKLMLDTRAPLTSPPGNRAASPMTVTDNAFKFPNTKPMPKQISCDEKAMPQEYNQDMINQTIACVENQEFPIECYSSTNNSNELIMPPQERRGTTSSFINNDPLSPDVDAGEECIDDATPNDIQTPSEPDSESTRENYHRQFSDILVIPDPFDQNNQTSPGYSSSTISLR